MRQSQFLPQKWCRFIGWTLFKLLICCEAWIKIRKQLGFESKYWQKCFISQFACLKKNFLKLSFLITQQKRFSAHCPPNIAQLWYKSLSGLRAYIANIVQQSFFGAFLVFSQLFPRISQFSNSFLFIYALCSEDTKSTKSAFYCIFWL